MLSRIALESAVELSEHLRRRGLAVKPAEDTPVSDMVDASEPITLQQELPTDPISENDRIVQTLEEATVVPQAIAADTHDVIVENKTQPLVELMMRRLRLAREVVNPLVLEYEELVTEGLGEQVKTESSIEAIDLPNFYRNPLNEQVFGIYNAPPEGTVKGMTGFQLENDNYFDMIQTGSEFIDTELNRIREVHGDAFFSQVYNKYFVEGEAINPPVTGISEEYVKSVDENLVLHFMARYFYNQDEVHSGEYDHNTEPKYRLGLLALLNKSAQLAQATVTTQRNWDNNEKLIGPVSTESIKVYGTNYRKFLQAGGNDYVIRGAISKGETNRGYSSLIQHQTAMESEYQNNVETDIRNFRDARVIKVRQLLRDGLPLVIERIPAEVLATYPEPIAEGDATVKIVYRNALKVIDDMPIVVNNLTDVCRTIVCDGLLPWLNFSLFFKKMDDLLDPNKGGLSINPKQAAYYIVVEELVEHFLSQVSLSTARE